MREILEGSAARFAAHPRSKVSRQEGAAG